MGLGLIGTLEVIIACEIVGIFLVISQLFEVWQEYKESTLPVLDNSPLLKKIPTFKLFVLYRTRLGRPKMLVTEILPVEISTVRGNIPPFDDLVNTRGSVVLFDLERLPARRAAEALSV